MRADRLLRLIVLLQRHRRLPARQIAERLEVSERTVLRDMEALSAAGVPVYTERGRGGGCVLLDSFTTDASGLTGAEAQALFAWTSRESAAELGLGSDLTGALAKVAASAGDEVITRAEELGAVLVSDRRRWFSESEQVPALPRLREAASDGRRLRIRYHSPGRGGPAVRTVDPWGLVDQSGRWYLVAVHRDRLRSFRASRIRDAQVLDEPVRRPRDRPLAEAWAQLRQEFERFRPDPVTVDVEVDPEIEEQFFGVVRGLIPGDDGVSRLDDGPGGHRWRLVLRARRAGLGLAIAWAPGVRVLAPDDFVAELRRVADVVARTYG